MHFIEREHLPDQFIDQGLNIQVCLAGDLPDNYVELLVEKSTQPHIVEFEGPEDVGSEDAPGRFRSIEDYHEWADDKKRVMYLMVSTVLRPTLETPDIGGIIWFSHRSHPLAPGRDVTFSIRHYDGDISRSWGQYRGRKLGSPFMHATHQDFRSNYSDEKIWLDLVEGNPAIHLYERNGYVEVARFADPDHHNQRRIVMVNDGTPISEAKE